MKFKYADLVKFNSNKARCIPQLDQKFGLIVGLVSEIGLNGPQYIVMFADVLKISDEFLASSFILDENFLEKENKL